MRGIERITKTLSNVTVGTMLAIANAVLAEQLRARARRRLERGLEPPRPVRPRSSVD